MRRASDGSCRPRRLRGAARHRERDGPAGAAAVAYASR
nr:MAG TPA: hypothetical protein [Caudoviricetes sp.]